MLIKTNNIMGVWVILSLTACAVGPDYKRPDVIPPATFKEEANHWKLAEPQDHILRGKWWQIYGDIQLNALVQQVSISNQNIHSAEAQYQQALGLLGAARARYLPTVTASFANTRAQPTRG